MLNVNVQKRQGRAVCLLYHFSTYLNELHPQVHKGGDSLLNNYGSSAAVNSVIVIGPRERKEGGRASPLCASGYRWCHTRGAGGWERAHQQLWNAGSSRRTRSYPDTTPLWGWSASLGRGEREDKACHSVHSLTGMCYSQIRLSFTGDKTSSFIEGYTLWR